MTHYSTEELKKLVNDGMETIEFIQQNKEDLQKTYGRSAIEKPTTKERTAAWEQFRESVDKRDVAGPRGVGCSDRAQKADGSDVSRGVESDQIKAKTKTAPQKAPRKSKSDKNSTAGTSSDISGGNGATTESGNDVVPKRGSADGERVESSPGNNQAGGVDVADYNQILNFDAETSKVETDPGHPTTMLIRDATAEDLGNVLTQETGNVHKRLRGIASSTLEPIEEGNIIRGVKKGHRREYCIDTFGGKAFVREWCNPLCSKITATPIKQVCVCGGCPRVCPRCIKDSERF
ncbi:V protein [Meliandou praomys virus]|uniref:Non-structural protein V n=1 Tax=Meliandou praomys virus TaxID=2940988 RepID=A0AAE9HU46_9MONO|nr:V protein [Meliandou praomys virus]